MANWKNLDTLASYNELKGVKKVNLKEVMSDESGAERVKKYSVPMAGNMAFNYAAKEVDDSVLEALKKLAEGESTKIVVPTELSNVSGLLASLTEVVKTPTKESKKTKEKKDNK